MLDANKMKIIPYLLVIIRSGLFIPMVLSSFDKLKLKKKEQIFISSVIITSDIFDGIISRKYNGNKQKLIFRLLDTIVDKTGIFFTMRGLYRTNKLPKKYYEHFIKYSLILLVGGSVSFCVSKNKNNECVEANIFSRAYAGIQFISAYLYNNNLLNENNEKKWSDFVDVIAFISLTSQLNDKIKKDNNNVFIK